jgi:hypothetical protein
MRPLVPTLLLLVIAFLPRPTCSQPSLASLWPNADGTRWDYTMSVVDIVTPRSWTGPGHMRFEGTVQTAGGMAQILLAAHGDPDGKPGMGGADAVLAAVWRARPDLRPAIAARYGDYSTVADVWYPLLLHDGYFMKTADALQMWQPAWNHPSWTYATSNLAPGAEFTHQLIPEIADNVFLHGTVEAIDATIATPAATFVDAVRMVYEIDYGWAEEIDHNQLPTGRLFRSLTIGHVHFAPDTGPVEMHEEFIPYAEIDCGSEPCPPDPAVGETFQWIDMSLTASTVAVRECTFSQIKALYR